MRNKAFKYVLLSATLVFLIAAFSAAAREPQPQFVEEVAVPLAGSGIVLQPKGAAGEAVYIVRLKDVPLASYHGGVQGLDATSPAATGDLKLDMTSPDSVAYRDYLADKQAVFLSATEQVLGREVVPIYQYDVTFNGVAITLSPSEASAVAKQPGVATVQRDMWRQVDTDVSPQFINADQIWDGSAVPGLGTKGQGIVVGVIDTGIWPEHPSFADDGSYPAPPAGWGGGCQAPSDGTDPLNCTDKLIGAKHFLAGYNLAVGGYDGLFNSARDDNGHGTHTASTAAGNENVAVTLLGVDRGKISGIAPRAYVAAYKALGPQGGVGSDLVAAIDAAVADGVNVINYSVGGSASNPWSDPDALAFLSARDAGVFVATSAGNSGPGADTVGSPGNAPWLTTVGASTHNRQFISDITLSGPGSPPTGLFGASVTKGVTNFNLVDAEGIADQGGDSTGRCINPYPAGTFKATDVVLCQRGAVSRVVRGDNILAGGGGGVILYNAEVEQGLSTDNYVIPAVHVLNATGLSLKAYIADHPGQVKVSFTEGAGAIEGSDTRVKSDVMADFSSRGPNGPVPDVIKPDVTAPGAQILAGNTPECIDSSGGCGAPDQLFMSIQGTSMSSPHVAGAGALLAALHPTWTPAEIESALITTGITEVVKENGSTQADPFDMGGGRINVSNAANAPLILNETVANYQAADPSLGGDPKEINNGSLANSDCVMLCSWQRTVQNSTGGEVTWDASITGLTGSVDPASFTLEAGETQVINVTVTSGGLDIGAWAFGAVELDPQSAGMLSSRLPIAVKPTAGSFPETVAIDTRRDAGSFLMEDLTTIAITEMTIRPYGLVAAKDSVISLKQDPTNDFPYDDLSQVWYQTRTVPDGSIRFVNEITASTATDVDLFVGFDDNGNGKPDLEEEVCASISGNWDDYCNVDYPKAGSWWILVQNWSASNADAFDSITLATAIVPAQDTGNMSFDAPDSVPTLEPFDFVIKYDLMDTYPGQTWFGAFSVGTDAANPGNMGKVNVDLYRHEDDVVKSASEQSVMPGDTVEFMIHINSNVLIEDVDYTIVDLIPDGLTYVAGSAEASVGTVEVEGDTLTWTGTLVGLNSLQPSYNMSTSVEDKLCDTPIVGGGYINLENYGIFTQAGISGDENVWFITGGDSFNFFGVDYSPMYFTDDGFVLFDADNNIQGAAGKPQLIPNKDMPNNLAAMLWQDMEIVYNEALNKGVSIAGDQNDTMIILEFDDVQIYNESTNTYDFEIIMRHEVSEVPGVYEIFFAYDNLAGDLSSPLTIGVENTAGDTATAFINNSSAAGKLTDDMVICFDSIVPATDVTITYAVTVDNDVKLGDVLKNMATSTTSSVNSKEETTYAGVYVGHPTFTPVVVADKPK